MTPGHRPEPLVRPQILNLDDADLAKEIAFADGFSHPSDDEATKLWRLELHWEQNRRQQWEQGRRQRVRSDSGAEAGG